MSKAEQDLAYVQAVVRDSESTSSGPRSIYILWAFIYLARRRGAMSGRVAWQFVLDLAGREGVRIAL